MIKEKNKIKVVLTAYGSLTVVSIPMKLYKDSYRFTDIECLVPKTINSIDKSFVKIYANTINTLGEKIWASQTYNLPYEKTVSIDGFEYEVYCGDFPEEFCKINGSLEVTFAYGTLNENDEFLSRLPSATLNLYIGGNGYNPAGVVIAQHDVTAAKVNELTKTKVDKVSGKEGLVLVADGVGGMKPSTLPIKEYEDQKAYIDEQNKNQNDALQNHLDDKENPHEVTVEQLGLENVDNTSDEDKPISKSQQEEFNKKINYTDIVDNCESEEIDKPVSANQARIIKEEVSKNTKARHTHSNKNLLDSYDQSNEDLTDAVNKRHTHSNKTTLDNTNEVFNTEQKQRVENSISAVSMDNKTGVFTFVRNDGTSFTLDTLLEKVVVNFHYDQATKKLILEHEDGTTQEIPMNAFINLYTGVDGTEITVSVSSDNKISAVIKNGSIGETKLSSALLSKLNGKADASSLSKVATSNQYKDLDGLPLIPEGVVMYEGTGQNTDGAMTQKASTNELNKKVDKSQGEGNANKVMITNASGEITPSNAVPIGACKCYTETDAATGEVSFVIEFPD